MLQKRMSFSAEQWMSIHGIEEAIQRLKVSPQGKSGCKTRFRRQDATCRITEAELAVDVGQRNARKPVQRCGSNSRPTYVVHCGSTYVISLRKGDDLTGCCILSYNKWTPCFSACQTSSHEI